MTTPDRPKPHEHVLSIELSAVLAALEDLLTPTEQWEIQGIIDGGEYGPAFERLRSILKARPIGIEGARRCRTWCPTCAQAAEAMLELFELHVAVGELVLNFQLVSAAATELAAELSELAGAPERTTSERLQELAKAATKTRDILDSQSLSLRDIQRSLDSWNIARPSLRLI